MRAASVAVAQDINGSDEDIGSVQELNLHFHNGKRKRSPLSVICCCGSNVTSNVRNISVYQMVISVIFCVIVLIALSHLHSSPQNDLKKTDAYDYGDRALLWTAAGGCIVGFLVGAILYCGVKGTSLINCRVWVIFTCLEIGLQLLGAVLSIVVNNWILVLSSIAGLGLNFYFMWEVILFMKKTKEEGESNDFEAAYRHQEVASDKHGLD